MGKQTVDWSNIETWQHLVASMVAAGGKPNLKAVAKYYGTTYNTLENRFRKINEEAKVIKEEVDSGAGDEAISARSTPVKKPPTKILAKKSPLETVTNGRVTKTKTPIKKKLIKQEPTDSIGDAEFELDSPIGNINQSSNFMDSATTSFSDDMFSAGIGMEDSDFTI